MEELELVKVWKRKTDGKTFVQFGNDGSMFCDNDDSCCSDIPSHLVKLEEFELVKQYWQEA